MGASATQDEDIIIFNDESGSEELEIVNGQEPKKASVKEEKVETKVVETEDLISFGTEEETEVKEDIEVENDSKTEDTSVEESIIDLVSEEDTSTSIETEKESPSIEEQLKSLELTTEETTEEVTADNISLDILEDNSAIQEEEAEQETTEEISLEVETEAKEDLSSDDFKNQLIEAQDGISFEDMGIDLDKLGDSEGENLQNIEIEAEAPTKPETSLEAETAVFGGVALLGLEGQEDETASLETETSNLTDDMSAFGDLTEGMEEVDEGTHDGILEAAILKLVNRDKAIDAEVAREEEVKTVKKDEIAELKKQIKGLQGEVSDIDKDIKELELEKATTNKTREGLEKMKIAA